MSSRVVVLIVVMMNLGWHMLLQDRGGNLGRICGVLASIVVPATGEKIVLRNDLLDGGKSSQPGRGDLRALESLVAADSLAAVEVAVHAGIGLVHHVGLVRTGSVGSRAGAVSAASAAEAGALSTVGTGGRSVGTSGRSVVGGASTSTTVAKLAAAVEVRVDTRVGSVGSARVVRSSGTLRKTGRVTRRAVGTSTGAGEARGASGTADSTANGGLAIGASTSGAAAIAVRVDTGVSSVGNARVVRASSSLGERGITASETGSAMSTVSASVASGRRAISTSASGAATITIRVNAGVGGVGNARVVGAGSALRKRSVTAGVASCTSGATNTSCASCTTNATSSGRIRGVVGASARGAMRVGSHVAAVVAIRVDPRVQLVHRVGLVRAISGGGRAVGATSVAGISGVVGASRVVVSASEVGGVAGTVIAVRVNSGIGSVGGSGGVRSVCALRLLGGLVRVDGFLDLVDERRHGCCVLCDVWLMGILW